ncbi:MAG TPA: hypothetical protein DCQ06_04465 [Myxococcales bacterium]|nr:hypothetical protein [Myxococcales bacterium]
MKASWVAIALTMSCMSGCIDDTDGATSALNTSRPVDADMLILRSDYSSSSLSWANSTRAQLISEQFFHSGTVVTSTGLGLSGDVVLPSAGTSKLGSAVLDRTQSLLTWVGGPSNKPQQWVLSDGFSSNPQDVVALPSGRVAVFRAQTDPTPTDSALAGGDDVLIFEANGEVAGRVALSKHSTLAGGFAWPGRGCLTEQHLWAPLASLSKDFTEVGTGKVVSISLGTLTVSSTHNVPSLRNCTNLSASADGSVLGVCSGSFRATVEEQRAQSGVFRIDSNQPTGTDATLLVRGSDWKSGGGVGFEIVAASRTQGWFVRFGQIGAGDFVDGIYRFEQGQQPSLVYQAAGAFRIGQMLLDTEDQLWFTEQKRKDADILAITVTGATSEVVAQIATPPGALPALGIVRVSP